MSAKCDLKENLFLRCPQRAGERSDQRRGKYDNLTFFLQPTESLYSNQLVLTLVVETHVAPSIKSKGLLKAKKKIPLSCSQM